MLVDGYNSLQIKDLHNLQKTFEEDYTVSFAVMIPTTRDGFWGYFMQKGKH